MYEETGSFVYGAMLAMIHQLQASDRVHQGLGWGWGWLKDAATWGVNHQKSE